MTVQSKNTGVAVRAVLLALALLSLGAAAAPASGATPYVIPIDLPLTGPAGFFGQAMGQLLRLYEKHVNEQGGIHGAPVQFAFSDNQSNPQVGLQLVTAALANKPAVVLEGGPFAACLAIAPLLANGPVQYCLSPAMHPAAGSYSFAGYFSTENIEIATARYFHEMGWNRIGMIATTDASGEQGVHDFSAIVDRWPGHDLKLVDVERFNPSDVGVAAQVARLKASAPQVVVAFAAGGPFGTILRALNDAGLDVPVNTSSANTTASQLAQYANFLPGTLLANGSIFNMRDALARGPLKDACNELAGVLRQAHASDPGATELIAWDAGKSTVSALRALPAGASAQQLRDYILALHDFDGVDGTYDFRIGDQHGLTDQAAIMMRWNAKSADFVQVSKPGGIPL
jgi:branched-chain amino acid transport system substrate-binding protein